MKKVDLEEEIEKVRFAQVQLSQEVSQGKKDIILSSINNNNNKGIMTMDQWNQQKTLHSFFSQRSDGQSEEEKE